MATLWDKNTCCVVGIGVLGGPLNGFLQKLVGDMRLELTECQHEDL